MDAPLISVIVPVYKVEAYLDRCVQSIVDQTYTNLEIILVDDGSPDNCPAMCEAWAEKDSRIRVIHKENGGGAQSRNVGLDCSRGAYIGFVDSDDFLRPRMYEYLLRILTETGSDIAECGYCMTDQDAFPQSDVPEDKIITLDTEGALRENIRDRICRQLLWNKLYTREVIGDIRLIEGKTIDDEFFTYRVLAQASQVAVGNRVMYAYRQQSNSIMHQRYSLKWLAAIEAKCGRLELMQERFPNLVSACAVNLLFSCIYHGQLAMRHLEGAEKQQAIDKLKKTVQGTPVKTRGLSVTHKCWLVLAKWNFTLCCRVRNTLGVGL